MKKSIVAISVLVLLLSSCLTTGLPVKESNDDTVLIVYSEVKETVEGKKGRAPFLEFRIDLKGPKGKAVQFLPTEGNIEIISGLPAGEYTLGTIMTMKPNKMDTDPRYKADAGETFELKAGEITILPFIIQAVLEDRDPKEFDPEDNEPFYTKAGYREITDEDKKLILEKLKTDPNFSSWMGKEESAADTSDDEANTDMSDTADTTNSEDDASMPADETNFEDEEDSME